MKSVASLASLSPLFLLVACYGAAPPKPPRIPLPQPVEGAEIAVYSEDRTAFETIEKQATTCPQGKSEGDPSCTVTRYNVKEPVTRTYTTATYNNAPISYAQFHVMTDAGYENKLAALDDHAHKCKRANVPRYAGMGLLLGGVIAGPIVGDTTGQVILWGGVVGGLASYALGYFAFGGRDCNEARAIYNDVNVADEVNTHTVTGGELAAEMASLASQFNATHAAGSQSAMRMRYEQ